MVIVVEGIDRVGKTTFVNKLSKRSGIPVFKHDASSFQYEMMDNENETDKMLQLLEMVEMLDGDVIFDRFHMSEFVYGVINRGYLYEEAKQRFKTIDEKLASMGAVVCYIKPVDIERSVLEHGRDLKEHSVLFDTLWDGTSCNGFIFDYNAIDKAVKQVDKLYSDKLIGDLYDMIGF